jgi:hypothetical protein
MSRNAGLRWLEALLGVLLVGLIGGELLVYSAPLKQAERTLDVTVESIQSNAQSTRVRLNVAHGSSDSDVRLAAFPLAKNPAESRSVFVYDDAAYASAGVGATTVQGVFDHVAGELLARQYTRPIVGLSAAGLGDVLKATGQAGNRVVVMMTGVLPTTVFSRQLDLVSPWVQAGGLAVWGGGAIGFWSGVAGQPLTAKDAVGETGTEVLLGRGILRYPTQFGRIAGTPSAFATALGISYKFASAGVLRDPVLARGGLSLGWYSGAFSSLSYVPEGLGGYLIFGGEILDEIAVSVDLVRILLANAIYGTGQVVSKDLQLSEAPQSSVVNWDIPFSVPDGGAMFVAFDPNPDGIYFSSHILLR